MTNNFLCNFKGVIEDAGVHTYNGDKCLMLKIHSTDDKGNVYEITIPHILLSQDFFKFERKAYYDLCPSTKKHEQTLKSYSNILTIGNNCYTVKQDCKTNEYMTATLIKKAPPKEMTMEELEKKLGYSVKIVSRKEK